MPDYDGTNFTPPAPIARVTVRGSDPGASAIDVLMLLDTGADVTLVPWSAVEKVTTRERAVGNVDLVGFDGRLSSAAAFELELVFAGKIFRGRFLATDEDWGILGRNVLNLLPIVYDGPRSTWDLLGPSRI